MILEKEPEVETKGLLFSLIATLILVTGCKKEPTPGAITLHEAVRKGDNEQVKLLISNGFDVNAKDIMGQTPLHWTRSMDMAKVLLVSGADVNAKDDSGNTPLHETLDLSVCTHMGALIWRDF